MGICRAELIMKRGALGKIFRYANSHSGNQTIIRHFTFNYKTVIFDNEKHELLDHNISRFLPDVIRSSHSN